MAKGSYIANSIIEEYNRRKKYKLKIKLQKFHREKCLNCKNKNTDKCNIKRDTNGNLKCVYYEV